MFLLLSSSVFASGRLTPVVWFEQNTSRENAPFAYRARLPKYSILLSGSKVSVRFPVAVNRKAAASIDMTFLGASHKAVLPGQRLPGCINDFAATDSGWWRRDIPAFSSLRVPGLYRGIDLVYRGVPTGIEYDFLVSPGANPQQIRIQFRRSEHVVIHKDGVLAVSGPGGEVHQSKPVAYQEWAGTRLAVEAGYVWRNGTIGIQRYTAGALRLAILPGYVRAAWLGMELGRAMRFYRII